MRLILFGAPGSGKGTQAEILAEEFNLRKISLGDILREEVKKNSELGVKVKQYMDRGDLVPDTIVNQVISQNIDGSSFILDGYPRNRGQAETLDNILTEKNISLDAFIYLEVSQATIVERLSKRRVCKKCRVNYHLETMPPKKEEICDLCGSSLIQRDDDNPEVIRKRWDVFLKNSQAVFDFYRDKEIFLPVDGNKNKEEVLEEVKDKLKNIRLGCEG